MKQNEFSVYDGKHDAIISEEEFELAKKKRAATAKRLEKKHDLEHEHQLSGIVRCPICGSGLVGNVNRKREKTEHIIRSIISTPESIVLKWMDIAAIIISGMMNQLRM